MTRPTLTALILGCWFSSSAIINGISRYLPLDHYQAAWLRLNWWETAVHIGCVAALGVLVWREKE